MDKEIFSDGIGRISVIGGVVRADLITFSPTETDANGQPRPVFAGRLVMGLEAFLRSSEKMQEAVQAIARAQSGKPMQQVRAQSPQPAARQDEPSAANDKPEAGISPTVPPFP